MTAVLAMPVDTDCLDFAEKVSSLCDKDLLTEYGALAKARLKTVLGNSYSEDKEAENNLYTAFEEIQKRIERGCWHPVKERVKRTFR